MRITDRDRWARRGIARRQWWRTARRRVMAIRRPSPGSTYRAGPFPPTPPRRLEELLHRRSAGSCLKERPGTSGGPLRRGRALEPGRSALINDAYHCRRSAHHLRLRRQPAEHDAIGASASSTRSSTSTRPIGRTPRSTGDVRACSADPRPLRGVPESRALAATVRALLVQREGRALQEACQATA
jgi:hypothetical protein